MPDLTKEDLQERAQLVRIHQANCEIDHPNDADNAFRYATMKKLAQAFGYKEVKGFSMTMEGAPKGKKL